jgi:hypothetical protein
MKNIFLALLAATLVGCTPDTLFEALPASHTGIHFTNTLQDNDSLNVLDVENIYNGSGVGVGDFNNDGLQDLYFAGNTVSNKLYLNKGDLKFEDVTEKAGVGGEGRWSRGVSVVDINNDGLLDIYVAASLSPDSAKRENLLYINKGIQEGKPRFANEATAYGLADRSHSTMAAFFDYDNDGDLDMYLLVNEILKDQYPNTFRPIVTDGTHPNTDKLFRNDWNDSLKHPVFTNVSAPAGITIEGYGHGVNITDINRDGWKDIYVTNDFLANNLLYINQKNGTFVNEAGTYFKHTAENAMGQDIIDINNDGLVDIIEADMNPEDNYRKKMMLNPLSYQRYQNNELYGYQHQYVRNVVQLNMGPRPEGGDSLGAPLFSDVAFMTGMAETDWSWTPSVADFNNDGFRDIIITNGFPKDVTDHDFIAYRMKANILASKRDILEQIPEVKIANYAYENKGGLQFANVTKDWGLDAPSFSNGAVYSDLDNDGDLDLVMNNINDAAFVYKNNTQKNKQAHYLQIQLQGGSHNKNGLGSWIELHYDGGKKQVYEVTPYRGYLSSIQHGGHFGLGAVAVVDTVKITWPDGKQQLLQNVKADQVLVLAIKDAMPATAMPAAQEAPLYFTDVTGNVGVNYQHHDSDFIDFNVQKLLPHKFSEYGPALAVGDVDGNGLDDVVCAGSFFFNAQMLLQQPNGKFIQKTVGGLAERALEKRSEDMGLTLFDADGDGDLDLYIASGSYEAEPNTSAYQDRFFINDGKGTFALNVPALPQNFTSKSCVRPADFDKDGDLDLFIAGRVDPWHYPRSVASFIYRNDSQNGQVKFTDVTEAIAPGLKDIGMVCDAVWTDVDNDGWPDLALAGEWMPLTFIKNNRGKFNGEGAVQQVPQSSGWWTSIVPADFDNDGDMDYAVGNLGKNSYYRNREGKPVCITAADFDNNGSYDAIPSLFLPASATDPTLKEFPGQLRDDLSKQMISMRSKYQTYQSYARTTLPEMLTPEQMTGALRLEAVQLQSVLLRNDGGGKFEMVPLPLAAQVSVLKGMIAEDVDEDGNLDLLVSGNDFSTEVAVGRYDALHGLVLKGNGQGQFTPVPVAASGLYIPGNGKALVKLRDAAGNMLVAASQNKGPLKIFRLKTGAPSWPILTTDAVALVKLASGKTQRRELNFGAGFLSQSGRFFTANKSIQAVEVMDVKGNKRTLAIGK